MHKIMIIEDDPSTREELTLLLENEGHQVLAVTDFTDVAGQLRDFGPHLALLDLGLPGKDGFTLCMEIRRGSDVPIIFLTSRDSAMDELQALNLGGDDYITKPFCPLELVARVKAQLRLYKRYNPAQAPVQDKPSDVILHSGLELNTGTHDCFLHDKPLALTPTEFSILRILLERKGKVVSSEELFHEIWKDEYYSTKPSKRRKKPFTPTMAS